MSRIKGQDARTLRDLGIKTICDFRTNDERARRPTRWHLQDMTDLVERDHEHSAGALKELARRAETSIAEVRATMQRLYRELPYEQSDSYRQLFARIAEGRVPLIFNCSAGKDRTGVAAALLLTILRVPRPIIVEDYALTNDSVADLIRLVSNDPAYGTFVRDRTDVAMPLLRAEPEYLETMFDVIEGRHESLEAYLEEVLGVTGEMQESIRRELVE
jgi:protein-tyrosine phosphatase